jgi:hypothetical protein
MKHLILTTTILIFSCTPSQLQLSETLHGGADLVLATSEAVIAPQREQAATSARESVERAVAEAEECTAEITDPCPDPPNAEALYLGLMEPWTRLDAILRSLRGIIGVWAQANLAWRETGDSSPVWSIAVCQPLSETVSIMVSLAHELQLEVPGFVAWLPGIVPVVCELGAGLAEGEANGRTE